MAYLGTPSATMEIIQKYGFRFQKKYGQNFLIDSNILDKIISSAQIGNQDCVIEIGPGIGTMSQYLAEKAREVIVVEIDSNLIPVLQDTLSEYENVTIINADILKLNIMELVNKHNNGQPVKIVANLPYYITTPIIMGLFESHIPLESITIMVQKEVADRMQVGPGSKDYGALSLAVQYYANPEIMMMVPPSCFMPRPDVTSAVIRLTVHHRERLEEDLEKVLFSVIRASFNQRRKTLVNGLCNSGNLGVSREQICLAISGMGLPDSIRGEALTLEQFQILSKQIWIFQQENKGK